MEMQIVGLNPSVSEKELSQHILKTSAIKKNEIMPFAATRMDLEIVILGEVRQAEKDKYHIMSLICGIYFLIDTNELYKIEIDTNVENKRIVTKEEM